MKFCIDCKHCLVTYEPYICKQSRKEGEISLVTGEIPYTFKDCEYMRKRIKCGKEAKLFEPKD
jgi:hypothetical protein